MPKTYHWIDPQALKFLHEESLSAFGGARGIRDIALFESAMAKPQNVYAYSPDVDVATLAASYGYGLAKNHAFVDGNKRVAFVAVGLFLGLNGYRLTASQIDAIHTMMSVAAGDITEDAFADWIRKNISER